MTNDPYVELRLQHLEAWEEKGEDPYPASAVSRIPCRELLERFDELEGRRVEACGRLTALREHGKTTFADLRDQHGGIQLYFRRDELERYELLKLLDLGDIVWAAGALFRTRTGEATIRADDFRLLAKAVRPLPEKWHGLQDVEIRYRRRYLDLIANEEVREVFARRSRMISAIRRFLDDRGFLEAETPILHLLPGGAAAAPFKTHHEAFDLDLYLRVAPELYLKRLLVGGIEKVYEIGRNFRNEGVSTWHNPEFTMLEVYEAYQDLEGMIELTEALLSRLAAEFGLQVLTYQGQTIRLSPPFSRIPFLESLTRIGKVKQVVLEEREEALRYAQAQAIPVAADMPHGQILHQIFERVVEPKLIQPTFVTDFPRDISPLAKPKSEVVAHRFELFIAGREFANAFAELNDPRLQRRLFEAQATRYAHKRVDEDFLCALEQGMPPAGGMGLGLDRLAMLFNDKGSIREVILFPLLRPKA